MFRQMGYQGAFGMPVLLGLRTSIIETERLILRRERDRLAEIGAILKERLVPDLLQ
jgi:hypothetical protein